MSRRKRTVFISSTGKDLVKHREKVHEACERLGFAPWWMERDGAASESTLQRSLEKVAELVPPDDSADEPGDLYLGIFGYRYGTVPDGHGKSITHQEYDAATARGIPCLVFEIDKRHKVEIDDIEMGEGAEKLKALKGELHDNHTVGRFESPEDLGMKAVQALSEHHRPDVTRLHRDSTIPSRPEPYVAHPYTLLPTDDLVGRQNELRTLTEWVTGKRLLGVRVFHLVAIGGMGKSAVAWKWFKDVLPNERPDLEGAIWWSFYESDAGFENFVTRSLAYLTGTPEAELRTLPRAEREDSLLALLDRMPCLLVLDGLERILLAYSRLDAARMADDDLDERTANIVAGALGLPDSAPQSFTGQHRLRMCSDPRDGRFLQRLLALRCSRVLVTTRLYPVALQRNDALPQPGSDAWFLRGLHDDDALHLWRSFKVKGSREELLPLFDSFENYPLLIRALAGEVANYRPAPGGFARWRADHPDFNPSSLPLATVKTHVLDFALRGLGDDLLELLGNLAGFRMPAGYDTLAALHVGTVFDDTASFHYALDELEDRGLVGWDRQANRYDLHPIVRGCCWNRMETADQQQVFERLHDHFDAIPRPKKDYHEVDCIDDLAAHIEFYRALVGLGRFDEASEVFRHRLAYATHYRLSASRLRIELLEPLFPDGVATEPRLGSAWTRGYILNSMAMAQEATGYPGRAESQYALAERLLRTEGMERELAAVLSNLSDVMVSAAQLRGAEAPLRESLLLGVRIGYKTSICVSLYKIGRAASLSENAGRAERPLRIARSGLKKLKDPQFEGVVCAVLAAHLQGCNEVSAAAELAEAAWDLAAVQRLEVDFVRAARVQGVCAVARGDNDRADERLSHALSRARAVSRVDEELRCLVSLARLRLTQGLHADASDYLEPIWDLAAAGPYPLIEADARNLLAEIERDAGNTVAAIAAATRAYELSWCEGPPWAYGLGLQRARDLLAELSAPEPQLPPFDESQHEPMPELDLDAIEAEIESWKDESDG